MMDLVIAMVPYVDGQNIKKLYDLASPWLQVNELSSVNTLSLFCSCNKENFSRFSQISNEGML